jgi:hypothetical protein
MEIDPQTGAVQSLVDRDGGREWVHCRADHSFGAIIVRSPSGSAMVAECEAVERLETGAFSGSLRAVLSAPGHPRMEITYGLRAEGRRVHIALAVLKDPQPLLEAFMAFPFALPEAAWTIDTPFCPCVPGNDRLPGAFANRLTVQDWVRLTDGRASVLWSSLDAPVISPVRLWPSRISPAHACVTPPELDRPPQKDEELVGGTIYSLLTSNNFGTNFAVSQEGSLRFRYELTTCMGRASNAEAASFAQSANRPLQTIFTKHPGDRTLPPTGEMLRIDNPAVRMVALKRAENGHGVILRLWNTTAATQQTGITFPSMRINSVLQNTLTEVDTGHPIPADPHGFELTLDPMAISTLRIIPEEAGSGEGGGY